MRIIYTFTWLLLCLLYNYRFVKQSTRRKIRAMRRVLDFGACNLTDSSEEEAADLCRQIEKSSITDMGYENGDYTTDTASEGSPSEDSESEKEQDGKPDLCNAPKKRKKNFVKVLMRKKSKKSLSF